MQNIELRLLQLRRSLTPDRTLPQKQAILSEIAELEQQVPPEVAKQIAQQVAQEPDAPEGQLNLL